MISFVLVQVANVDVVALAGYPIRVDWKWLAHKAKSCIFLDGVFQMQA